MFVCVCWCACVWKSEHRIHIIVDICFSAIRISSPSFFFVCIFVTEFLYVCECFLCEKQQATSESSVHTKCWKSNSFSSIYSSQCQWILHIYLCQLLDDFLGASPGAQTNTRHTFAHTPRTILTFTLSCNFTICCWLHRLLFLHCCYQLDFQKTSANVCFVSLFSVQSMSVHLCCLCQCTCSW